MSLCTTCSMQRAPNDEWLEEVPFSLNLSFYIRGPPCMDNNWLQWDIVPLFGLGGGVAVVGVGGGDNFPLFGIDRLKFPLTIIIF